MPGGLKDHGKAGLGSLEESGDQETVPASLGGGRQGGCRWGGVAPRTRAEALSGWVGPEGGEGGSNRAGDPCEQGQQLTVRESRHSGLVKLLSAPE